MNISKLHSCFLLSTSRISSLKEHLLPSLKRPFVKGGRPFVAADRFHPITQIAVLVVSLNSPFFSVAQEKQFPYDEDPFIWSEVDYNAN